jgi:uncharacterized protein (TIGR02246 family)
MIRKILIVAVASTLLGSQSSAAEQITAQAAVSAEEAEVKSVLLNIIDRFNRHELGPAEDPGFTVDADFVNVEGRWMKGLAEIRGVHKEASKAWLKDAKITPIELEVRFIRPDVVVAHQLHEMTGLRHPDGTLVPPHREISTRILVKEQGKWITTAFQNMIVNSK